MDDAEHTEQLRREASETRAARRDRRVSADLAGELSFSLRLVRILVVAAAAGLAVLASHAHPVLVAGLLAWASAGLAWGWPAVTRLRSVARPTSVIVVGGLLVAAAGGLVTTPPHLRLVPIALAGSVVLMFLLQLMRGDGRAELTREVVATGGALAFVGMGAGLVGLARLASGPQVTTVAMAAVVASLLADALAARTPLKSWLVPLVMVVGGLAGVGVTFAIGGLTWGGGLLVGMLCAAVSYSIRRIIEVRPGAESLPGQVTAACASVLGVGALAHVGAIVLI